jgi:multisubunit Na+/H+ antiporter MnhB subunit
MDKRKRRRAAVLGMVGILFIVLLVSVVNFDMHGGDRNSAFFMITCFLSTMSGVTFIVILFDPWRDDTVK